MHDLKNFKIEVAADQVHSANAQRIAVWWQGSNTIEPSMHGKNLQKFTL